MKNYVAEEEKGKHFIDKRMAFSLFWISAPGYEPHHLPLRR